MTFAAPDATASGKPYPVTDVGGSPPRSLEQFVGECEFGIDRDGRSSRVKGVGAPGDDVVRFHEKDLDHSGKDVRVWAVRPAGEGRFTAETISLF